MLPTTDFVVRPGPGEKGMAEKQVLLSKREMTLHFSTVRTTQGPLIWMSRTGAWTGVPRTIIRGNNLTFSVSGDRDNVVTLTERAGFQKRPGLSPRLPPIMDTTT
jgi:hypothetical protein